VRAVERGHMSTRGIQALIEWAERGDCPHADEARAELEALRGAARSVVDEKALEDWNTAMPANLADSIRLLQVVARETTCTGR
jgi:uncharacterized protein YyaL (SSP411 family)